MDNIHVLICTMCVKQKKKKNGNQFHTALPEKVQKSFPRITECAHFFTASMMRGENKDRFVLYLFNFTPPNTPINLLSSPCPDYILCYSTAVVRHLGGALRSSAGFELGLVGVSGLRGQRGGRVPSLQEVALVPGGLGEHLQPALLVLLQASPELCTLPLSLHLPTDRHAIAFMHSLFGEAWLISLNNV